MVFRALLITFIVLSGSLITPSQAQHRNLKFEHIGSDAGLSHSNILCILQDSRGFMWFGTRNGLNKYDGYMFTLYKNNAADSTTISNDRISDLAEDADGNIWIATLNGGLDMFDWRKEKFIHYISNPADASTLSSYELRDLTKDHEGNLWIGTLANGACMLDRKTNKFIRYVHLPNDPNTVADNAVNEVLEDGDHNIWMGTLANGISVLNRKTNTFHHYVHDPHDRTALSSDNIEKLFLDSKNRVWIGTRNGLNLFDGKGFKSFKHDPDNKNSLVGGVILSIEEDADGNIWIGTENGGLSILSADNQSFSNYVQDDVDRLSLNNNSIWSLFRDVQGNMWIGTFSEGISFVNREISKFTHYRHSSSPQSLSNNSIWAVLEDSKKNIWIGTDGGGMNLFDRKYGTFTAYKHDARSKSISGNYVLALAEDITGNIWIGTWGEGITIFNPKNNSYTYLNYKPGDQQGLSSANVWCIYKDQHGKMWIGTYSGGIDVYDVRTKSISHYRNDPNDSQSLANNTVSCFYEDKKGTMWIGTNGGLNKLNKDQKTFKRYAYSQDLNSISNDRVLCIEEDANGNLWIGTDIGLNYFDTKSEKFTRYHIEDGLPSETINSLLLDEVENLWIASTNGISRFSPTTKTFTNFNVSYGLQSIEFKKGGLKSSDGKFYFGGPGGLNEFTPGDIRHSEFQPPLFLTNFEVFNKPIPISADPSIKPRIKQSILATTEIELTHEHSVFSIEFASLNYTNPEHRQYTYKLEGFDKEWTRLSPVHSVNYTNLDPGEYTFKVKGMNNEGVISDHTVVLKIIIIPPFWNTWWFKVFIAVCVVCLIMLIYIFRTQNIRRINHELAEAVKAQTVEINEKNKILYQQREELAAQNEELLQSHEEISAQRDLVFKQNEMLETEVEKRTQELVEYNHQLEQFAFIAAHNLRAPVARILGLGNLLDISGQTDIQREQIYPRIIHATRELDVVVKDLNTILYLKKNSDSVITLIDLPTEVDIIIENLAHEISMTKAKITTDFSKVTTIRSVKPYFDSIIYNLVSNAIKYRHPERSPVINIQAEQIQNEICLRVSDNGLGIDVDLFQDKLFTLYSRFHLHIEGKGMGLYLVKTQLAAMGGRIEIESKVNEGTTFSVYFKM